MADAKGIPAAPQILVVDDETIVRDLLKRYFTSLNYQVMVAQSAEQMLNILETNCPNLILLDLQMPGIGGLQAIPKVRALYKNVPIVVLTAVSDEITARQALESGATDYVTKPVDLSTLKRVLMTHILFAA
jgi:two-component system, NtrC family, response regulator AtoC